MLQGARSGTGSEAKPEGHEGPTVKGEGGAIVRAQVTPGGIVARECASDGLRTRVLLNCVLGTIFKWSEVGNLAGNSS